MEPQGNLDEESMDYDQNQPTEGPDTANVASDCDAKARKRRYSELDDDELPCHNTDCDCSLSENDDDDEHNESKKQRTDEVVQTDQVETTALALPTILPPIADQTQRAPVDLRREYLRTLSPRTLHRTLMDSVGIDDCSFSFSDSSTSSLWHHVSDGDMDYLRGNSRRQSFPQPEPHRIVEYEIGSVSPSRENPNPIENMASSTNDEDELPDELRDHDHSSSDSSHWSAKEEAERGSFADSSDSESNDGISKRSGLSSDSELSDQDKWFCSQCNAKTNVPYLRYCLRCFNLRRNWLPPRPKGKGKTRPPIKVHRQRVRALYTYPPEEEVDSVPCSTPDDDRPGSHSSKGIPSSHTRSTTPTSTGQTGAVDEEEEEIVTVTTTTGPSHELSIKLQSTLNAPPLSVALAPDARDEPLCIICMGREKNAAFVHGKTAHFVCCYQCGDKILKRAGKCPVCRKRILRVVKIIS